MSKDPDDAVDRYFSELPYNLKRLVKAVGFPSFQSLEDDEVQIYERLQRGFCMTCGQRLGKTANFIISTHGIVAGYCSGICHSDMAVMGFLQQEHDEIVTAIKMRGNPQADAAPPSVDIPDSLGDDPATREDADT